MTRPNKECHEMNRPDEALCAAELDAVSGGSNLANMRHESLKAVAQNLRA